MGNNNDFKEEIKVNNNKQKEKNETKPNNNKQKEENKKNNNRVTRAAGAYPFDADEMLLDDELRRLEEERN